MSMYMIMTAYDPDNEKEVEERKKQAEDLKDLWESSIKDSKAIVMPVLTNQHSYWMYEAFEEMHKQGGTTEGRGK